MNEHNDKYGTPRTDKLMKPYCETAVRAGSSAADQLLDLCRQLERELAEMTRRFNVACTVNEAKTEALLALSANGASTFVADLRAKGYPDVPPERQPVSIRQMLKDEANAIRSAGECGSPGMTADLLDAAAEALPSSTGATRQTAWLARRVNAAGRVDRESVGFDRHTLEAMGYDESEIRPLYEHPSATGAVTREQAAKELEALLWREGDALTVKIHNHAVQQCVDYMRGPTKA